jgi:hypothetical protein
VLVMMRLRVLPRQRLLTGGILTMLLMCGCGTAVQRQGTEQLLLSDSVDRAIDQLDLSGLANRKVFLDTEYMKTFKGTNVYINSDYIISALRQKMTTSGLYVEVNRTDADYILEARVGALGTDSMEVTYGIPSSNGVGMAASAAGVPAVPAIPEMSFGKRNGMVGISKVVVYAYHRETGIPVWQSGAAIARSDARDSWMLGAGPLSQGSVYGGTLLAGNRINPPFEKKDAKNNRKPKPMTIADKQQYVHPAVLENQLAEAKAGRSSLDSGVQQAGHEQSGAAGAVVPADATATPGTAAPAAPATPVPAQPTLPPSTEVPPVPTAAAPAAPGASETAAAPAAPNPVPALPAQPPLVPPAP